MNHINQCGRANRSGPLRLYRRRGRAVVSLLLAILMLLPFVPQITLLANYQTPVTDLAVEDFSDDSITQYGKYQLTFKWTRPINSSLTDQAALNGTIAHDPEGYYLQWRNLTSRDNTAYTEANKMEFAGPNVTQASFDRPMDYGSLYMFKVTPHHTHEYPNPQVPPGGIVYKEAPLINPELTSEVLYLTDIRVDAVATESEVRLTWDNATFLGNDLFTGYNIYYGEGANANLTAGPANLYVSADDARLIRDTQNGKLHFTFPNDPSKIGLNVMYAIRVEPVFNGRSLKDIQVVRYNNKDYRINYSGREYRKNDLTMQPNLTVVRQGRDFVQLSWFTYESSLIEVAHYEVYASKNADMSNPTYLGTVEGDSSRNINYFLANHPSDIMYYQVRIYYWINKNTSLKGYVNTQIAMYNPALELFNPTKPNILEVTHAEQKPYQMDITWEAFVRKGYTPTEKAMANVNGDIIDRAMLYDIYVTDDITNFDMANTSFLNQKIVDSISPAQLREVLFDYKVMNDTLKKPAYQYTVQYYVQKQDNGLYVKKPIVDNKIYYFMIIGRRDVSVGGVSERAFYSHYYPPIEEIPIRPIMVAKPPLRIKKDENGIEMITKDSIAIEWDTNWYELYNEADKTWYSRVGVSGGDLLFGDAIPDNLPDAQILDLSGHIYNTVPSDPEAAYSVIYALLGEKGVVDAFKRYPIRFMDLGDAQYEIHAVPYDYMELQGGYDSYKAALGAGDWLSITPTIGNGMVLSAVVNLVNKPQQGPLEPNTAYTILLRPYRIADENKKEAYFPNYIVGTTLSNRPPVDVTPIVPEIIYVRSTDTTATVGIEYVEGLNYELYWSENSPDYPDRGILINDATLRQFGTVTNIGAKSYLVYTIERLFPNTIYYAWVRTVSNNPDTPPSYYSNAVEMKTLDIQAPLPPQGLGPAASGHVDIYNKENDTKYIPVDYDYMIVEWYRDVNDQPDTVKSPAAGGGNAAGANGEAPPAQALLSPNLLETYMVKFASLIGNKGYYFRAKTVLTITKSAEGTVRYYQYVIQMSPYIDFSDVVELTVPTELADLDPVYTMRKESGWTDIIRLVTNPSTGEYDADKTPDTYPLPKQDFEIIYDRNTDTLTYRYRSDQIDQEGNRDNRVDQRFISTLIQNKIYNVVADVSSYNNKPVKNGIVEMPYAIVRALEDRKISLTIKTSDMSFTLMPGFAETAELRAATDLSPTSKIAVTVKTITQGLPGVGSNGSYVTSARQMTVTATTASKLINLPTLAHPYKAELKIGSRYLMQDRNTDAYTHTANDTGWVRANGSAFDQVTGMLSFHTARLATYAGIARTIPKSTDSASMDNAIYTVGSRINIMDLPTYNPGSAATSNQVNQVIAALASGKKDVAVNSLLADEEQSALSKAGMLTSGQTVPREVAVSAFMKLYEVKTKSVVKDYAKINETPYTDIKTASSQYQTAMLKAAELGFFRDGSLARPKEPLTLGDLFYMADIVIQDAGL